MYMPGKFSPACGGVKASLFVPMDRCSRGLGRLAVVDLDVHGVAAAATDRINVSGHRVSFPALEVLTSHRRLILH